MNLVNIAHRIITVELEPEDALVLATACQRALADDPATNSTITAVLACGLEAMAMAAVAQSYADLPDTFDLAFVKRAIGPRDTRWRTPRPASAAESAPDA